MERVDDFRLYFPRNFMHGKDSVEVRKLSATRSLSQSLPPVTRKPESEANRPDSAPITAKEKHDVSLAMSRSDTDIFRW